MTALNKPVQLLRDLWSGVLDLIYPPHCLVCKGPGNDYLCAECVEKIDIIQPPCCRKCGVPCDPTVYICAECREREYYFEFARSVGIYENELRDAIHALKFACQELMARPLGELMARCYATSGLPGKVDVAVPIPIHRSRLVERGFNQSAEIARVLCKRISLPLQTGALVKTRKTRDQVNLPEDQRFTNLEGAFAVPDPHPIAGKRVLIIDDVLTTGATANEAAKTLRSAGASAVYAYTLARRL